MGSREAFEPMPTSPLDNHDRQSILARVTDQDCAKYLRFVYEALQRGQDVFTNDGAFMQASGFSWWAAVNIAKLLVDDGYLEQMRRVGEKHPPKTASIPFLRITARGVAYLRELQGE